jgi:hypothetical protein
MDKICKYCKAFYHSEVFKKDQIIQRRCKTINKLVQIESKACSEFVLNPLFFCEKNTEWIKIEVCFDRRKNHTSWSKRIGCKKCRQFTKEIIFHYHKESKRKLKRRS